MYLSMFAFAPGSDASSQSEHSMYGRGSNLLQQSWIMHPVFEGTVPQIKSSQCHKNRNFIPKGET